MGEVPDFIEQSMSIGISQAVLGDEFEIETVYGKQTITIQSGCVHNSVIVVEPPTTEGYKGRSMPMTYAAYKKLMRNSTLEGNEGPGVTVGSKHLPPSVVKVAIKIPESLNDQQRQILENILWINY